MASPNRSRTPEEIQASLAPPGAGIPLPMRVVLRLLVKPLKIRPTKWEANEEQFLKAHRRFSEELRSFPKDRLTERVLVPKQRGLEDSSRYWSAAMVARHLTIVGGKMEQVIAALSRGERLTEVADTAKVKPETERNEASAIAEYLAFGDGVTERLRNAVEDRSSPAMHQHPWFGAMNAKDWFWLLGMHTSLHRHQLKNIRKGLLAMLLLLAAPVFLGGCAGLKQHYKDTYCNADGGFERGMNDGREGKEMASQQFQSLCDPDTAPAAIKGYQQGYQAGLANLKRPVYPATSAPGREVYACSLDTMTEKLVETDTSSIAATQRVVSRCLEKYSGYHCNPTRVVCARLP